MDPRLDIITTLNTLFWATDHHNWDTLAHVFSDQVTLGQQGFDVGFLTHVTPIGWDRFTSSCGRIAWCCGAGGELHPACSPRRNSQFSKLSGSPAAVRHDVAHFRQPAAELPSPQLLACSCVAAHYGPP